MTTKTISRLLSYSFTKKYRTTRKENRPKYTDQGPFGKKSKIADERNHQKEIKSESLSKGTEGKYEGNLKYQNELRVT